MLNWLVFPGTTDRIATVRESQGEKGHFHTGQGKSGNFVKSQGRISKSQGNFFSPSGYLYSPLILIF